MGRYCQRHLDMCRFGSMYTPCLPAHHWILVHRCLAELFPTLSRFLVYPELKADQCNVGPCMDTVPIPGHSELHTLPNRNDNVWVGHTNRPTDLIRYGAGVLTADADHHRICTSQLRRCPIAYLMGYWGCKVCVISKVQASSAGTQAAVDQYQQALEVKPSAAGSRPLLW